MMAADGELARRRVAKRWQGVLVGGGDCCSRRFVDRPCCRYAFIAITFCHHHHAQKLDTSDGALAARVRLCLLSPLVPS